MLNSSVDTKANLYAVPREPLLDIFTSEVISKLSRVAKPSRALEFRLRVLRSGGLDPSRLNQELKAYKAAWEAYILAAFACGFFEGAAGVDLRNRLAGIDDANFRSAMSECFAAWFIVGRLRLQIEPRPKGKGNRSLDFLIKQQEGNICVEVKAPHRAITNEVFWGTDSDLLENALVEANKQFDASARNLLIIVPQLRLPIFQIGFRMSIEQAFIGEPVISIPLSQKTGGPVGPARIEFKENGRFVKKWLSDPTASERRPRFTRIGATLFLGEYIENDEVKPRALIVHNPNAITAIPRELWGNIPTYVFNNGQWKWTDADASH